MSFNSFFRFLLQSGTYAVLTIPTSCSPVASTVLVGLESFTAPPFKFGSVGNRPVYAWQIIQPFVFRAEVSLALAAYVFRWLSEKRHYTD